MKKTVLRKRFESGVLGWYIKDGISEKERNAAFEATADIYCSQNDQDCDTCGLVNYGQDCHNYPL